MRVTARFRSTNTSWPASAGAFARARIEGRFDGVHQFLVVQQHPPTCDWICGGHGVETIGGQRLLVNRGWSAAPASREQLPNPGAGWARPRLPRRGGVRVEPRSDTSSWDSGWPKRVQHFDGERMSQTAAGRSRSSSRLEEGEPGASRQIIARCGVPAHGYAVQWFAMSAALVIAFIIVGLRRGRDE